ncbi:MAG TPA: glycosyltransferase [Ramlibacter sp.]|uniref:glycosyltransferase family 2 protein n=1 Tax=Ramlibacter sp. TaxID=1917967 RepID=UPI002ED1D837
MAASDVTGSTPLVSVCIANYNGMQVIDDCVRSILEQEGGIDVEILVHDDASSDDSAAHIRACYPDARLIESSSNVGFCVANNRMVAQARGKYILLLNNDAALYPDALASLLAEADRLGRPAILGLPQYDAASGELIDIGSRFDPFLNPVPNLDAELKDVGMIIGACLWLPRTLWAELGGFPEWFHTLAEDMWLCARARLAGHPVRAIARSGFRHRVGHSLGGGKVTADRRLVTSRRRRALSERNKSFVMAVTYPSPLFQVLFPLHLVLLLLEGAVLALAKRDLKLLRDIYFACLRSLWQERKRLIRLRQEIQAERVVGLRSFWSAFQAAPYKLQMLLRHGFPHLK